VAVSGVRVRSTVDRRARRGHALVPSLGKQHQDGGYHRQHEYETGDGNPDSKTPLRYANGVRIVDSLKKKNPENDEMK